MNAIQSKRSIKRHRYERNHAVRRALKTIAGFYDLTIEETARNPLTFAVKLNNAKAC